MNWPYRLVTAAVVVIVALAAGWGVAQAGNPRPECAPPAKPHCKIHWVAYDYEQYGVDQVGNHYVRYCHVPARGKRHCGAWMRLRRAFPIHHASKADLR